MKLDAYEEEYETDDEEDAAYSPGWCPLCGDPETACLCGAYPDDEMDEWRDDNEEESQ